MKLLIHATKQQIQILNPNLLRKLSKEIRQKINKKDHYIIDAKHATRNSINI